MEEQRRNGRVEDRRDDLPIQPPRNPSGGRVLLDGSNSSECEVPNNGGVDPLCEDLANDYYITLARMWDDPQRDFDINLKK